MDIATLLLEKTSSEEEKQKIIKYSDPTTLNNALHHCAQQNHVEFASFLLDIIESDYEILIVCYLRDALSFVIILLFEPRSSCNSVEKQSAAQSIDGGSKHVRAPNLEGHFEESDGGKEDFE